MWRGRPDDGGDVAMKLAFLYAGQGSQHAGMGRDLHDAYPEFRAALDAPSLPFDLKSTMFEDGEGLLDKTEYTQPCMVAFACGLTAVLKARGIEPGCVAGLSLGEYSALAAAGVLDADEAVELAAFRGRAMASAADGRPSGMVSVLGLDHAAVERVVAEVAAEGRGVVEVSNYNTPRQTVIAGDAAAVERAAEVARDRGARRCVPLKVSGPFHTSLLSPAGDALRDRLAATEFGVMRVPVLFNCLGREMGAGDDLVDLLVRQVQSAVRMDETIARLGELGVDAVIEIGPGRVLSGMVRSCAPQIRSIPVETVQDVEELAEKLEELR